MQDGIAVHVIGRAIIDVAFIVVLYDMIYLLTAIVWYTMAAVQFIFTHKQYTGKHNEREYTEHEMCNNKNI